MSLDRLPREIIGIITADPRSCAALHQTCAQLRDHTTRRHILQKIAVIEGYYGYEYAGTPYRVYTDGVIVCTSLSDVFVGNLFALTHVKHPYIICTTIAKNGHPFMFYTHDKIALSMFVGTLLRYI